MLAPVVEIIVEECCSLGCFEKVWVGSAFSDQKHKKGGKKEPKKKHVRNLSKLLSVSQKIVTKQRQSKKQDQHTKKKNGNLFDLENGEEAKDGFVCFFFWRDFFLSRMTQQGIHSWFFLK